MKSLDSLLQTLRVSSLLQNRVVVAEPWGVLFPASPRLAQFHFVEVGEGFLMIKGEAPVRLRQGDLAIVLRSTDHCVVDRNQSPAVDVRTLVDRANVLCESGITLHFGGEGVESSFITGQFRFEDDAHPLLRSLPSTIVLRGENGQAPDWIDATLKLLSDESMAARPGVRPVLDRLCGVLFIQSLRGWIRADDALHGLPAAMRDPAIDDAIHLIHTRPGEPWTVERLAHTVSMSRSAFAERFRRLLNEPPMDYLMRWRMHLACEMLQDGSNSTYNIAQKVGYESEASFSKAFKRTLGVAPGRYRKAGVG